MTITVNNGRSAQIVVEGLGLMDAGLVETEGKILVAFRAELSQVRRITAAQVDGVTYRVAAAEKGDVKGTVRLTLESLPTAEEN